LWQGVCECQKHLTANFAQTVDNLQTAVQGLRNM